MNFTRFLSDVDWKRGIALCIFYGYMYVIVLWPILFWFATLISSLSPYQIPAPPIVPWEQLLASTATLTAIGGIQFARDREANKANLAQTIEASRADLAQEKEDKR